MGKLLDVVKPLGAPSRGRNRHRYRFSLRVLNGGTVDVTSFPAPNRMLSLDSDTDTDTDPDGD